MKPNTVLVDWQLWAFVRDHVGNIMVFDGFDQAQSYGNKHLQPNLFSAVPVPPGAIAFRPVEVEHEKER